MEQCGVPSQETNSAVNGAGVVTTAVAEKHESEPQEKTVFCTESLPQLHNEDCTGVSLKEDGELSSSSDTDCNEQAPAAAADDDDDALNTEHIDHILPAYDNANKPEDDTEIADEKPFESYRQEVTSVVHDVSDSDTDSTFSDSSDVSSEHDLRTKTKEQDHECHGTSPSQKVQRKLARTRGELLLEDLPPIEDLHITIDDSVQFKDIGKIVSVVGVLVIVQSNAGIPPLDEDTVLFLRDKVVLGKIFETFGPVSCPLYSIRFNSGEHIIQRGVEVGADVCFVPSASEWTHYVFLEHVKAMLGSDASWENDNEPPAWCLDYSDDETERRAKAKLRMRGVVRDGDSGDDEDNDSSSDDDSKSPHKTATCRQRNRSATERHSRHQPKITSWPPSDRPHRGRGVRSRGRRGRSFGRGQDFRGRPGRPWIHRHQSPSSAATFPASFPPPDLPVQQGPLLFSPQTHPSFPPPPPSALMPPRFIAPPPYPPLSTVSAQQAALSPRFIGFSPNTTMPPSPNDPGSSCPAPMQPWTFGMLPSFVPPFPPPPLPNAVSNCWNLPPPPPPSSLSCQTPPTELKQLPSLPST